ncbi:uncharacterized protein LOC132746743 [Ruditapes philippinarum]|uniref:uncharacterized protein LOC132746743 n=1 Tax=Ruditapes philippinarum TaxID=129788 RepID=UPI00295B8FCD|nr:uncharacterized protein LOC132746743 [Ruditapes philippinarum]
MARILFILVSLMVLYPTLVKGENNVTVGLEPDTEPKIAATFLRLWKRTKNPLIRLFAESFDSLERKFDGVEQLVEDANIERQISETDRVETSLRSTINKTERRLKQLINDKFDTLAGEICNMYTCTEWSEWTKCDSKSYLDYGLKNRTRECKKGASFCSISSDSKSETESAMCQSVCPDNYTETPSKYCVKLFNSIKRTRDDAELLCQQDGGHLINIDSATKSDDVTEILKQQNPSERVWIDGIQRSYDREWEFSYGLMSPEFTNWKHDQPNGNTYPNCMYLLPSSGWLWADFPCDYSYNFMCEISSD